MRSADARVDRNGPDWTIDPAGAAFHTAVTVLNQGFIVPIGEYRMRADPRARLTTDTQALIKTQAGDAGYISEIFHKSSSSSGNEERGSTPEQHGSDGQAKLHRDRFSHFPFNTGGRGVRRRTGKIHSQIGTHCHDNPQQGR